VQSTERKLMDDSLLYAILLTYETKTSLERAKIKAKKGFNYISDLKIAKSIAEGALDEIENAIINTEFSSIRKEEDE